MIQAICWMLIHSLWQGLLFTIVAGIVLVYTKKSAAAIRYNLLSGLFFLFMAVCALTFLREWRRTGQQDAGLYEYTSGPDFSISSLVGRMNEYLSEHASLIVMGWCIIFLFKCVHMIAGMVYIQRVRNYGVRQPSAYWQDKVFHFSRQLQIKRTVQLLESKGVKMPFVTGHWKPVIFIPLGLLTKLPEGEIEAVLLHELAHIRRNDYFINFLQHIGESIFFFNPGLLWISSLLREERENCCDDIAIDRTRDKMEFVRALISFREYDLSRTGAVVPFPAGRHQLLQRVTRIVHNKNKSLSRAEKLFFMASFCIISLLLASSTHQGGGPSDSQYKIIAAPTSPDRLSANDRLSADDKLSADPARLSGLLSFTVKLPAEELTGASDHSSLSLGEREQAARDEKEVRDREMRDIEESSTGAGQSGMAAVQEDEQREQAKQQDREQALRDKLQAEKDAMQAALDRMQAIHDQEQADRDRAGAIEDQRQADQERAQAEKERAQADRERLQAMKDRKQADRNRAQAEMDRKQADRDRAQAEKDQGRTSHSQH